MVFSLLISETKVSTVHYITVILQYTCTCTCILKFMFINDNFVFTDIISKN